MSTEPLLLSVDAHGYLCLKLSGILNGENYDRLKKEVDDATSAVEKLYKEHQGIIRILLDISDFSGTYSLDAMVLMKKFAEHNRPFVYRTGVYGGTDAARVAAEITVALAGRDNIKFFKTKELAVAWLEQ